MKNGNIAPVPRDFKSSSKKRHPNFVQRSELCLFSSCS
ncbi:hypothetical protein QSI_0839 [Clostridioides difficile P28]|nr:hypothetical protein QSI_0839 [Clostridioides difficile P28]